MNYGNTLMAKGDFAGALDYFHRAQQLTPQYSVLLINLAAWRERDIRYLLLLPWVFASLHVSYGLGSVAGVTRVVSSPRFWGSWWPWIHGRSASTR